MIDNAEVSVCDLGQMLLHWAGTELRYLGSKYRRVM